MVPKDHFITIFIKKKSEEIIKTRFFFIYNHEDLVFDA